MHTHTEKRSQHWERVGVRVVLASVLLMGNSDLKSLIFLHKLLSYMFTFQTKFKENNDLDKIKARSLLLMIIKQLLLVCRNYTLAVCHFSFL